MIRKILLSILLAAAGLSIKAQPGMEWQTCLGGSGEDNGFFIQQTADSGYIVAGNTASYTGQVTGNHGGLSDYWVVKLDQTGNLQWQRALGGTGQEMVRDVKQTTDGGYIVCGLSTSNDGDVTGNHLNGGATSADFWIVKLDAVGTLVWEKSYGGSGSDEAHAIQQTADGGYIITGQSNSGNGDITVHHGSSNDVWLIKTDALGTIQWQKCYGGSDEDGAYGVRQTFDGGFIAIGFTASFDGNVSGFHGIYDYWVIKTDTGGTLEWQKAIGGSQYDWGYDVIQAADSGYVVVGDGRSDSADGDATCHHGLPGYGRSDFWMLKLSTAGNIQWQRALGGSNHDIAHCLQKTADGAYLICGSTSSTDGDVTGYHGTQDYDFWVVKTDTSGSILWSKTLGGTGNDEGFGVTPTLDGWCAVTGKTGSNSGDVSGNNGYFDFWVVKLGSGTGITEQEESLSLQLFPNPAAGAFTIMYRGELQHALLSVWSPDGTLVYESVLQHEMTVTDLKGKAAGIYFVKIQSEKGVILRKLILQ